jgi:hypothetical protein
MIPPSQITFKISSGCPDGEPLQKGAFSRASFANQEYAVITRKPIFYRYFAGYRTVLGHR